MLNFSSGAKLPAELEEFTGPITRATKDRLETEKGYRVLFDRLRGFEKGMPYATTIVNQSILSTVSSPYVLKPEKVFFDPETSYTYLVVKPYSEAEFYPSHWYGENYNIDEEGMEEAWKKNITEFLIAIRDLFDQGVAYLRPGYDEIYSEKDRNVLSNFRFSKVQSFIERPWPELSNYQFSFEPPEGHVLTPESYVWIVGAEILSLLQGGQGVGIKSKIKIGERYPEFIRAINGESDEVDLGYVPEWIRDILIQIFVMDPSQRPTIHQIVSDLTGKTSRPKNPLRILNEQSVDHSIADFDEDDYLAVVHYLEEFHTFFKDKVALGRERSILVPSYALTLAKAVLYSYGGDTNEHLLKVIAAVAYTIANAFVGAEGTTSGKLYPTHDVLKSYSNWADQFGIEPQDLAEVYSDFCEALDCNFLVSHPVAYELVRDPDIDRQVLEEDFWTIAKDPQSINVPDNRFF